MVRRQGGASRAEIVELCAILLANRLTVRRQLRRQSRARLAGTLERRLEGLSPACRVRPAWEPLHSRQATIQSERLQSPK